MRSRRCSVLLLGVVLRELYAECAFPLRADTMQVASALCAGARRLAPSVAAVGCRGGSVRHVFAVSAARSARRRPQPSTAALNTLAASSLVAQLKDKGLLKTGSLIDGQWTDEHRTHPSASLIAVVNPANGELVVSVAAATKEDTDFAIASAETAFHAWKCTTARERSRVLYRWFELVTEHRDDLATILTMEQGKPFGEAIREIDYSATYFRWFSEEAVRAYGMTYPGPATDRRGMTIKQPIGVCAAITPWNFPTAMLARKVAACVAAGCTMVAKPSEFTPLSALALAELALRAGVPKGVFNVVVGDKTVIGNELTSSQSVRKLSFTGSTRAGITLMQQCAATVKRTSMELGGNAPFIVFEDADLQAAVSGLMTCKFRNAGQTCVSANRVLVHEDIHDAFVKELVARASALKVGDGFAEGTEIGPLINEAAVQKVERHVADAVSKGAAVACGGKRHETLGSNFYLPTVLTGCSTEMHLAHEETFGPIASLFRFKTEAEALAVANATDAGLAGYVFSNDASRLMRVAEGLEVGMVGMNTGIVSADSTPFGGVKASGHGREGSMLGMDEYLEVKALSWGLLPESRPPRL